MIDVAAKTRESSLKDTTVFVVAALLALSAIVAAFGLYFLPLIASATLIVSVITFLAYRHVSVLRRRRPAMEQAWKSARKGGIPDAARTPPSYVVYVLGSGGHTSELCEMIRQQFRPNPQSHRRYIITSGDHHSEHAVARLEGQIAEAFPSTSDGGPVGPAGTWDVFRVVRARHVHQPLWTAWYTAALSALSLIQALVRRPQDREDASYNYPHLIVTNGPGTGFVVCLVAHLLKMLYLVPSNVFGILYIETWAHVRTLSLTGKLFYRSDIADMFVVQHAALAAKTGQRFIGEVAKYGNLLGIRKPFGKSVEAAT